MSLKVKVGPAQLSVHRGHTVLLTEPDGRIETQTQRGLYFYDTRVISNWMVYANGEPWDLLNGGTPASNVAKIFLTNRRLVTETGVVAPRTLGLTLSRRIVDGLHEDVDLVNYKQSKVRFNLEVAVRSDFADIFEVKSGHLVRRGRITTTWGEQKQRLCTTSRSWTFVAVWR